MIKYSFTWGVVVFGMCMSSSVHAEKSFKNPIKHQYMHMANRDLQDRPHHVDQIKNGGEATRYIIKKLALLEKPPHVVSVQALQDGLVTLIEYTQKDAQDNNVAFDPDKYAIEDAQELPEELLREKLKERIFQVSRFILVECRKGLLHMLHNFRGFIQPLVASSFEGTHIDRDKSVLVGFLRYSGPDIDTYLNNITSTRAQLRKICVEYIVFSARLWHSLSKEVIDNYKRWVVNGRPEVEFHESPADVHQVNDVEKEAL